MDDLDNLINGAIIGANEAIRISISLDPVSSDFGPWGTFRSKNSGGLSECPLTQWRATG